MEDFSPGFVKNYCPCRRKLVKDSLDRHRKHKLSKVNFKTLISSKLKTSFSKNTDEKMKRNQERIFVKCISDNGMISRIY